MVGRKLFDKLSGEDRAAEEGRRFFSASTALLEAFRLDTVTIVLSERRSISHAGCFVARALLQTSGIWKPSNSRSRSASSAQRSVNGSQLRANFVNFVTLLHGLCRAGHTCHTNPP